MDSQLLIVRFKVTNWYGPQRRNENPVEHLRSNFFAKKVNGSKQKKSFIAGVWLGSIYTSKRKYGTESIVYQKHFHVLLCSYSFQNTELVLITSEVFYYVQLVDRLWLHLKCKINHPLQFTSTTTCCMCNLHSGVY